MIPHFSVCITSPLSSSPTVTICLQKHTSHLPQPAPDFVPWWKGLWNRNKETHFNFGVRILSDFLFSWHLCPRVTFSMKNKVALAIWGCSKFRWSWLAKNNKRTVFHHCLHLFHSCIIVQENIPPWRRDARVFNPPPPNLRKHSYKGPSSQEVG